MIQNMAKYIDAENDYLVINAKKQIVANLLTDSDLSIEKIAKIAGVAFEFVKRIQQDMASGK